jgi:hypothetical protein
MKVYDDDRIEVVDDGRELLIRGITRGDRGEFSCMTKSIYKGKFAFYPYFIHIFSRKSTPLVFFGCNIQKYIYIYKGFLWKKTSENLFFCTFFATFT